MVPQEHPRPKTFGLVVMRDDFKAAGQSSKQIKSEQEPSVGTRMNSDAVVKNMQHNTINTKVPGAASSPREERLALLL